MAGEAERAQGYLETVARLEPNISMIDRDAALASIAISLKRIADALDNPEGLRLAILNGITEGFFNSRPR